jgi:polar amino acid transport system substrate-binding protein
MRTRLRLIVVAFALLLASTLPTTTCGAAQDETPGARELVVGTKQAPPFAIKDDKGEWSGISIELWRKLADQLKLRYRFAEAPSVGALLDGVRSGNFDMAIAAITMTPEREQEVDFTTPYFHTGIGVAVQSDRIATWLPVVRSITSYSFLLAIGGLLILALVVGALIWLFERRNNEGFGGGVVRGLSSGVFWSANAMTQRVDPNIIPLSTGGRILAVIWMVVSVVAIAALTASITSTLTIKRLHGIVNSTADLPGLRVAVVQDTASADGLSRMRVKHRTVPSAEAGFAALGKGTIDAFAYDRPLLAWMIGKGGLNAELSDLTFDPQDYAIALRNDTALRKQLNVALLQTAESEWWRDLLFRYLGQPAN